MPDIITTALSVLVLGFSFYALNRVTDSHFVQSLEILSTRMRMTSDIAGASLMAMGSSAPELFTSFLALVKGMEYADLGTGTIVGSALFNILVIVGGTALLGTASLSWQPAMRDILFYFVSLVMLFVVLSDGQITLVESLVFVGFYIIYLVVLPLWRKIFPYEDQVDNSAAVIVENEPDESGQVPWYWYWALPIDWFFDTIMPDLNKRPERHLIVFVLSILSIILLSWLLVEAGIILAINFGVPEAIIGLTVLAVGTSIPDLLSSLIVARQGKGDMALSNAVGSNIFDILVGLGAVWVVIILYNGQSIYIDQKDLELSISLLMGSVVFLLIMFLTLRWRIGPRSGLVLVGAYGIYLISTVYQSVLN